MSILPELRKIERLRGDTYSSAEVLGAISKAAAEIERLRGLFQQLRRAWFKGADLDEGHVSQEALRIFIEADETPRDRCNRRGYHIASAEGVAKFRYDQTGTCLDCGVVGGNNG
jgi:hypothetical protein